MFTNCGVLRRTKTRAVIAFHRQCDQTLKVIVLRRLVDVLYSTLGTAVQDGIPFLGMTGGSDGDEVSKTLRGAVSGQSIYMSGREAGTTMIPTSLCCRWIIFPTKITHKRIVAPLYFH